MSRKPAPTRKNPPSPPLPRVSPGSSKYKILVELSKGSNPHRMSKKENLGLHRSTIQQHLKEMRLMGLTQYSNHVWNLTTDGWEKIGGLVGVGMPERGGRVLTPWLQSRAHNLRIKFEVLYSPPTQAWLKGWKANTKIKNNVFYSHVFGDITATYTGKSLIFQLPVMFTATAEEAIIQAGNFQAALKKKYEAEIPGLKLGRYTLDSQLMSQSHAVPLDPFAAWCKKNNISYHTELIDIDASHKKIPELEFPQTEAAHIHHERYVDFVENLIQKDPPNLSQISNLMAKTQECLQELIQSQTVTTMQIQTMVRLMQPKKPRSVKQGTPYYVQ